MATTTYYVHTGTSVKLSSWWRARYALAVFGNFQPRQLLLGRQARHTGHRAQPKAVAEL